MAQIAHIKQPYFTHVLNFWHNIKGGVLKAQRPHVKQTKQNKMKEKHLKFFLFFSKLKLVSGFLVVFYQLLRRKVQKTTSEFCSISEVIDFLNVFNKPFTEKVLC